MNSANEYLREALASGKDLAEIMQDLADAANEIEKQKVDETKEKEELAERILNDTYTLEDAYELFLRAVAKECPDASVMESINLSKENIANSAKTMKKIIKRFFDPSSHDHIFFPF